MKFMAAAQGKCDFVDVGNGWLFERSIDNLNLSQHVLDLFTDAGEIRFTQHFLFRAFRVVQARGPLLTGKLVDAGDEFFRDHCENPFLHFLRFFHYRRITLKCKRFLNSRSRFDEKFFTSGTGGHGALTERAPLCYTDLAINI